MVATRWVGWSLLATIATVVAVVAINRNGEGERAATRVETAEVVRCVDSDAPALARINRGFDKCLVEKAAEPRRVYTAGDGRTHVVVPDVSDIRICLRHWMCGQEPVRASASAIWRVWRNDFTESGWFAPMLACVETYDGAARIHYADNGRLIEIDTDQGSEVDDCLATVDKLARSRTQSGAEDRWHN